MLDLSLPNNDEEGMPSPTSNHTKTALVGLPGADKESESEGLPVDKEKLVALINDKVVQVQVLVKEEKKASGTDLVPIDNLVAVVNNNLKDCEFCKGPSLKLELDRRVGFATNWKLTCKSCDSVDQSHKNAWYHLQRQLHKCKDYKERRVVKQKLNRKKIVITNRKKMKKNRYITSPLLHDLPASRQRRVMDYAVNIRAVIASFYVGTGGLDIGLINSVQGVKGSENWEKTFTRHSPDICKAIIKVNEEIIAESLEEETSLTIKEKLAGKYTEDEIDNFVRNKLAGNQTGVDEVDNLTITVSFDMGWQKKGTGHTYDSNSGHAYYIGVRSGKVIEMIVYSKKCTTCDIAIAMGEEPMEHDDCVRNYRTGSSKAMEASAALQLILNLHSRGIRIEFIVSDDDSTMRAHLTHIGSDKGKLPLYVFAPGFLCDPSHRVKVMVKDIFALALMSNAKSECEKIDALRIKKYVGCMIGKSKLLPFEQFKQAANAPIEHLFGCHEWCDPSWCYAAEIAEAREKYNTAVATAAPETTATGGEEVSLQSPTEVITPTECCRGGEVQIRLPTDDESMSPPSSPINIMSDDSSQYACSETSSDSEEDIDTYKGRYEDEDENITFFRDLVPQSIDGLETMVFSTTDLEKLKEKEKTLREREEGKYFRSKTDNPALYGQLTAAMAPYLADDKLRMLAHRWSTQLNESMNNSVAAYAPKTKNFSGTLSLKTRVSIAAGVLALGYFGFWDQVFDEIGIEMDNTFASSLKARDAKKAQKRKAQKSTGGKLKRRKGEFEKQAEQHRGQMDDARTGKTYGAGVALAAAKKTAKEKHTAAARNPKGTPKECLRCPYYHPQFCTVLGHTSAASKSCAMNGKSKEERNSILATIKKWQIDAELALQSTDGT